MRRLRVGSDVKAVVERCGVDAVHGTPPVKRVNPLEARDPRRAAGAGGEMVTDRAVFESEPERLWRATSPEHARARARARRRKR